MILRLILNKSQMWLWFFYSHVIAPFSKFLLTRKRKLCWPRAGYISCIWVLFIISYHQHFLLSKRHTGRPVWPAGLPLGPMIMRTRGKYEKKKWWHNTTLTSTANTRTKQIKQGASGKEMRWTILMIRVDMSHNWYLLIHHVTKLNNSSNNDRMKHPSPLEWQWCTGWREVMKHYS